MEDFLFVSLRKQTFYVIEYMMTELGQKELNFVKKNVEFRWKLMNYVGKWGITDECKNEMHLFNQAQKWT